MECGRILAQLRQELDLLNEAIGSMENLAREGKRGRAGLDDEKRGGQAEGSAACGAYGSGF
jgi:hypothetical protein